MNDKESQLGWVTEGSWDRGWQMGAETGGGRGELGAGVAEESLDRGWQRVIDTEDGSEGPGMTNEANPMKIA